MSCENLNWCFGDFDGSKAVETDKIRLGDMSIAPGGILYREVSGSCEALGPYTLACLFLEDGRGGAIGYALPAKNGGGIQYKGFQKAVLGQDGWRPEELEKSRKLGFCICSRNGLLRTNVVWADK